MYVMLEQYHFLKCEEQFFSSNIINSPYRGLKWEIFQTKVVDTIKTHFMFNNFYPKTLPFMR